MSSVDGKGVEGRWSRCVQSGPLKRAAVPFQEEDHLPFRQQTAAPSIGDRTV